MGYIGLETNSESLKDKPLKELTSLRVEVWGTLTQGPEEENRRSYRDRENLSSAWRVPREEGFTQTQLTSETNLLQLPCANLHKYYTDT